MKMYGAFSFVCVLSMVLFHDGAECVITGWSNPDHNSAIGNGGELATLNENTAVEIKIVALTDGIISGYSLSSQIPPAILSLTNDGVLSLMTGKTLNFEQTASIVLVIAVTDSGGGIGTMTCTLSITNVNEAPAFAVSSLGVYLADNSGAGTTLTIVAATDEDICDVITYTIAEGNTDMVFEISSAGVITIANDKTVASNSKAGYELIVTATDDDVNPQTGSISIYIVMKTCSIRSSATAVTAALSMLAAGTLATLY